LEKKSNMKLISLLPINLREAEKAEDPATDDAAEGGEETANPFAAAGDEGGGEEGGEGGGEDTGADAAAGEEGGEEEKGGDKTSEDSKPLDVVFDVSRVRKYNDVKLQDNKGTVVAVSRYGLTIKLPDEQTILVNFEDIL
jgi:hypothetical protein